MKIKKRSLADIEFKPLPNRASGELFSAKNFGAQEVTFRIVDLVPLSEQQPRRPHWHEDFEEVIHVLRGQGRMWAEGEWHDVAACDTVLVPPKVVHATFNLTEEPLRLLCFFPRSTIEPFSFADEYLTLES